MSPGTHWMRADSHQDKRCSTCGRPRQIGPRTSEVETEMFYTLAAVLGRGERNVRAHWDGRVSMDMRFGLHHDRIRLGVEYDSAFFHQGREDQDRTKSERFVSDGYAHYVTRIREEPLSRLTQWDVNVDPGCSGSDAALILLCFLDQQRLLTPSQRTATVQLLECRAEQPVALPPQLRLIWGGVEGWVVET